MALRILLVDDHPIFLEGLQNLLEVHNYVVVGTAGNGLEALDKARALQPDVILMDIAMPVCSGLDAISPIKAAMPQVKIVMLTSFDNDSSLFESIKRGASGYMLKSLKAEELVTLLRDLEQGEAPLSPGLAARLLEEFTHKTKAAKTGIAPASVIQQRLTPRQTEILDLIAGGMTYKEVGATLNLSERTVKYHMERILELLQLENRAQAITFFTREQSFSEDT